MYITPFFMSEKHRQLETKWKKTHFKPRNGKKRTKSKEQKQNKNENKKQRNNENKNKRKEKTYKTEKKNTKLARLCYSLCFYLVKK